MFNFFLFVFLALTNAFVLPTDQLTFKPTEQDPNSITSVKPIDKDTFQIDWLLKKESRNPFAPKVDLKFQDFDLQVDLSQELFCTGFGCMQYFNVELKTNDYKLKYYDLECNELLGTKDYNSKEAGRMFERKYLGFMLSTDNGQKADFTASCKLKVTLA